MILGYGWLKNENPTINWKDETVDVRSILEEKETTIRMDTVEMVVEPQGKLPTRGSQEATGYDLYAAEELEIPMGGWKLVPTGVKMKIPKGSYGKLTGRSGNALQHGLMVHPGVIDSDYRGTVGAIIYNYSKNNHRIVPGMRIAQIVFEKHLTPDIKEVTDLKETERGEKGFGSTDQTEDTEWRLYTEEEHEAIRCFTKTTARIIGPRGEMKNKFKTRTQLLAAV
ncbi:dUTP diphosphatase [Wolfiporia cocos MD-104 SS10]|uniref:Deoxyuridine 5'-triphosphate nucleotidohydrolase n=1 Tax=Wolfiporia cocos (strain MD-104) TaxID=742152 RepID=A0A2H3JH85_WOLCO|nr:dUTP diphosphatase [Wolfiporia cocos MD-104 SS10]